MSIMHPSTRFFASSFYARPATVRALEALNARLFKLDDETVAEGRHNDPAVVAQVKDLESQIKKLEARKSREVAAALRKIRQVGSDRRTIKQPSQVSTPRAVSGQTAGAQHKTTAGDGDGDPEPAAHPVKSKKSKKPVLEVLAAAAADLGIAPVRAAEDPDPDDQVIPDPCKNDPRVPAYGDTSRTRYIRKAISAAKGHRTGRAADFYTAQVTASLQRMIRFHLNNLDIQAPADLVEQAATSLLLGLVKKHNFSRIPNPNLHDLVSKNIKNRANLREVANRTREKGDSQTGVDLLDVEAGLVRPKGPLPEVVLDYYSADLDPQAPADKAHRAYAQEARRRTAVGPQPAECPAFTSAAHRVQAHKELDLLEYAARAVPTTNAEDDFGFDDPLDDLVSGNAMDDPFLRTWAQELVDQGQMPAIEDDPDGDVRRAIDACGLMTLNVEEVLLMVANLSDEAVQDRAPAIFKAMACVEGCDTAQHRADLLRTRAVNKQGKFSPAIQQAAASLLKGAGYSL